MKVVMPPLNLPPCPLRVEQRSGKLYVYDLLRQRFVRLTPEEWVRIHFVHYLISSLGYPPELLMNEVSLQLGEKSMRADTILYNRHLEGQMIIEYKAPNITLSDHTLEQALRYNYLLQVPYLVLSNGLEHEAYEIDYQNQQYIPLEAIPSYEDLAHTANRH